MMVNAVTEFLDDLRGGRMEESPVVTVEQGQLQGRVVTSPSGKCYYSFQGVPYAKPPLGSLRFKAPEPAESWEGIRDATAEGNVCAQYDFLHTKEFHGDENCLFLNVYTPNLDGEFLPVIVYIHGGIYRIGSGNTTELAPDYIVEKDVVVVTVNYRLGPLGFLCLNTPEVPGNAGLKDIVAALRWVKENIHNFGGNSGNLTVAGESAGAAAASLFTASPLTKDLISKAIIMSGSSLSSWSFTNNPLKGAKLLAEQLGCDSKDHDEILEFLRSTPVKDLVEASDKICPVTSCTEPNGNFFAAVVEKEFPGVEAVVTEPFSDYLTSGRVANIPVLVGTTGLEFGTEPKSDDFRQLIPGELNLEKDSEEAVTVAEQIKRFYLKGGNLTVENWSGYFNLISDVIIVSGVHRYVKYLSKVSTKPIYVYKFDYDGGLNVSNQMQKSFGLNHAGHVDLRAYLTKHSSDESPQDAKTRERVVRLFTNFAKSGNPTPEENHYITLTWLPVKGDLVYYLNITNDLSLETGPDKDRMDFWDQLYDKYYKIWEQPTSNVSYVPTKVTENETVVPETDSQTETVAVATELEAQTTEPESTVAESETQVSELDTKITELETKVEDEIEARAVEDIPEPKIVNEEPKIVTEEPKIVTEEPEIVTHTQEDPKSEKEEKEELKLNGTQNGNEKVSEVQQNGTVNGNVRSGINLKTSNEIKMVSPSNGVPKDVIRANDPPEDDLPKNIGVNKFVNFFEALGGNKK